MTKGKQISMNKSEAIRWKCLDCNGSPKEVTLCPVIECALWPYRFGYSFRSKRYMKRMMTAKQNNPEEFKYLLNRIQEFITNPQNFRNKSKIHTFFVRNSDLLMPDINQKEKLKNTLIDTFEQKKERITLFTKNL
jgi:hypothetical protein